MTKLSHEVDSCKGTRTARSRIAVPEHYLVALAFTSPPLLRIKIVLWTVGRRSPNVVANDP